MNKSVKHIFIVSALFLLMLGVVSTASAIEYTWTPTEFLDNISNINDGDIIKISNGAANVSNNYTINVSNIIIEANTGQNVTFQSNTTNVHFIINGTNVTLYGITFRNFNNPDLDGGALYWIGGSGNISNCNFTNNTAYDGGALYWGNGSGVLNNCMFTWNSAQDDGGALCWWSDYDGVLYNCIFIENSAQGNGGALSCWSEGRSELNNCTFTRNSIKTGHGGALYWDGSGELNNCTFIENTAQVYAGALCWWTGDAVLNNCNFTRNLVANGYGGALCWGSDGSGVLNNCIFAENIAKYDGGALYWVAGSGELNNCTFNDNTDVHDVDIFIFDGGLNVSGGNGGLIYNEGIITNTLTAIILGNRAVDVAENEDFNLTAFIKVGNYTIIGPQEFNFTINNDNLTATLTGDHYTANYHVTGAVGDIIPVNGSYAYTDSTVNYQTGSLLIKNRVVITGNNATYPYNKKIEVKLNATTSNGTMVNNGTVQITINGKSHSGEVSNGKVTIEITDKIDAGVYYLTAVYEENYDYLNATFDFTLTITQINSLVGITVGDVSYGETAIVKIATIPEMTGNLTLVINGKPHSISTNTKEYPITEKLDAGTYSVYAYYLGDINFKFSDNLTSFTVKPIVTQVNVLTVDNSTLDKVVLHINASDIYNNPVNGTAIATVKDYGAYYGIIINGLGEIVIPNLPTGEYFADIVFTSTSNYKQSSTNCSFKTTSTPIEYNLTATNVYKEFENATQYHAILKDNNGNPLANKTISIAISSSKWSKDAYYRITTGNDGLATLTINLLPGSYIIRADYGNEIAINNITVIASNLKLRADNLVKYFMNGSQYTVKVTDVNNNPVANRTVTIAINKASWKYPVKYYVKTNADGIATLDINLIAGSYSVTANICYNSTKSSITVLPTLTASSITKKINKEANLKAKLVDNQGNPAQGKEVTFTVKDKTYYLTTDASGIATLPIHLSLGTWSFLIAYPDTGASTRATVKVIK